MAGWITHLWIADKVLERVQDLDRRGFCVGSIAPDCNVENADWSAFTPPREVTHWMNSEHKVAQDCERFYDCMVEGRAFESVEERSFFLGYYAHLVADAEFQRAIRDEERVRDMFARIRKRPEMSAKVAGLPETFDTVKRAFGRKERMIDVAALEWEYLQKNPDSGYLRVVRKVEAFPDYVDYLPKGAIVRKIGVMAVMPEKPVGAEFVFISRAEYEGIVQRSCDAICEKIGGR